MPNAGSRLHPALGAVSREVRSIPRQPDRLHRGHGHQHNGHQEQLFQRGHAPPKAGALLRCVQDFRWQSVCFRSRGQCPGVPAELAGRRPDNCGLQRSAALCRRIQRSAGTSNHAANADISLGRQQLHSDVLHGAGDAVNARRLQRWFGSVRVIWF